MADIAVVVGAAGGIGQALAEAITKDPRFDCIAALSRQHPPGWPDTNRQRWIPADILDEASLAEAATALRTLGEVTRIIVATGLLHADGISPEKSMRALSLESLTRLFMVNAAGPALAAKHLLPLTPRDRPSLFAALSARVGSIGDNHLGGWYAYRASKAALNQLIRTLAIEHRRTRKLGVCVALHPGTVDTGLSAPFQSGVPEGALFTTDYTAGCLLRVMDALGPEANGGFYAWDGTAIAW